MRVIVCPGCGRENRVSVRASACDQCGADISLLAAPPVEAQEYVPPVEPPPEPSRPQPRPEAAPPAPAGHGALIGRVVLAAVAIVAGLVLGTTLHAGSALSLDPYGAGSVAVLSAALGIIGLVLLLSGSGTGAARIAAGLRLLGFILAILGTVAAVALVQQPVEENLPTSTATPFVLPPDYPPPIGPPVMTHKAPKGPTGHKARGRGPGDRNGPATPRSGARGPRSEV